jgi:hypothetical protein
VGECLKHFSNELKKQGREYLNSRWTIAPTGGIDKIASFVALFNSQKLNIAVVTDFHKGDKKKVELLCEKKILESRHIFSINNILNVPEADIEDMLGKALYIDIVNDAYSLPDDKKIKEQKGITRVVEYVEEKFRIMPSDIKEFDHYFPSTYLASISDDIREKYDFTEAMKNFETLFKQLNKLIE